jgi:hypothetical protein
MMQAFYSAHVELAEALQKAMASLRNSGGDNTNPLYWAPFEVIGLPWLQPKVVDQVSKDQTRNFAPASSLNAPQPIGRDEEHNVQPNPNPMPSTMSTTKHCFSTGVSNYCEEPP